MHVARAMLDYNRLPLELACMWLVHVGVHLARAMLDYSAQPQLRQTVMLFVTGLERRSCARR